MEEGKKVKLVEYSCDKDNDTSGLQNHDAETTKWLVQMMHKKLEQFQHQWNHTQMTVMTQMVKKRT